MLITVIIISSRTVHGPVSHCDNPRTLGSVLSFSGLLHQMRYTNTYIYPKEIYILTEQQCQNKQTGKQRDTFSKRQDEIMLVKIWKLRFTFPEI